MGGELEGVNDVYASDTHTASAPVTGPGLRGEFRVWLKVEMFEGGAPCSARGRRMAK